MGYNPADDLPARHITDTGHKQTGAACPTDRTLVTCVGDRDENWLAGTCAVCGRTVYADATLSYSTGTFEKPDYAPPGAPPPKENDEAKKR